ncbi:MAG: response regulator [Gemmatimonadota bacterium]
MVREAESIFGLSSALRRARQVDAVLRGARILWVDDHPENNAWERSLLKAFGTETVSVETTRSAVAVLQRERFDVILSDITREGRRDEGIRALPRIVEAAGATRLVFYVGRLSNLRSLEGAFGITNHPNE